MDRLGGSFRRRSLHACTRGIPRAPERDGWPGAVAADRSCERHGQPVAAVGVVEGATQEIAPVSAYLPDRMLGDVSPLTCRSYAHDLRGRWRCSPAATDWPTAPPRCWPTSTANRLSRWPGPSPKEASGPEVRDCEPLMQLVALGQVVAVVPESVRRQARSDVACVPVLDAPRSSILLAQPERTRSWAAAAFVRASTEVAASGRVI